MFFIAFVRSTIGGESVNKFKQFSADTLKLVDSRLRSRLRDFSTREVVFLYNDQCTNYVTNALAIMPKTVYHDSHFCRNSALLLEDALRKVNTMLHDLEDDYLHPSGEKMSREVFQAHRGILLRFRYQLSKRYRRAEKLAVLEWKAEKESRRDESHQKYGKYRDVG